MTRAERRLWSALRAGRLQGHKFRRQQPLGPYIVDFFCAKARLVIELDGTQHSDEEPFWHDYHRTKWLRSKGYRVLRFRNCDVLGSTDCVVDAVWEAIAPPKRRSFENAKVPPSVAPSARQLSPSRGEALGQ